MQMVQLEFPFMKEKTMKKLLFFGASWCNPCKAMKPVVAELQAGGLDVEYIDVGSEDERAEKYKVTSIPTFVVLGEDGTQVGRETGAMPKAKLEALIGK
jgi:thioredoxin 1